MDLRQALIAAAVFVSTPCEFVCKTGWHKVAVSKQELFIYLFIFISVQR